jgi:hypothetical protein
MKVKTNSYTRITLGDKEFNIDSRIYNFFETKAGDKKPSLVTLAGEYVKEGKSAERALADALEVFKLV